MDQVSIVQPQPKPHHHYIATIHRSPLIPEMAYYTVTRTDYVIWAEKEGTVVCKEYVDDLDLANKLAKARVRRIWAQTYDLKSTKESTMENKNVAAECYGLEIPFVPGEGAENFRQGRGD